MLRILLASGEEAVYRTVEELAMGISSGTITAAALVFDARTQDWRSIDSHPEYHQALARAATLTMELESEPIAVVMVPTPVERASGPAQIYQMFSRSAAELQSRKRPAWLLPALTGVACLVMLVSVALALRGDHTAPLQVESDPVSPPQLVSPATARPAEGSPVIPSTLSVEAMRLAPVNLANHLALAMEAAGQRLADSTDQLGVRGLLKSSRLLSPDSVRQTRNALAVVRSLITTYRGSQRGTAIAYRDTAALLIKTGFWSKIDEQEWRLHPNPIESRSDAAQADSIIGTLDRLYDLLEKEAGRYGEAGGRLQFEEPGTSEQYDRLRANLARHAVPRDSTWVRSTGPLAVLLRAVNGSPPREPERLPVTP